MNSATRTRENVRSKRRLGLTMAAVSAAVVTGGVILPATAATAAPMSSEPVAAVAPQAKGKDKDGDEGRGEDKRKNKNKHKNKHKKNYCWSDDHKERFKDRKGKDHKGKGHDKWEKSTTAGRAARSSTGRRSTTATSW